MDNIQHPEITCAERTGYPSWMQEHDMDPETYADEYDAYCDRCYQEHVDRTLFGDP